MKQQVIIMHGGTTFDTYEGTIFPISKIKPSNARRNDGKRQRT